MLGLKYLMPPLHSRGINRDYLVKVYKEEVYRVLLMELKHFEVDLSPSMSKRVGILNNCLLVRKVNFLLRSLGRPELGFDEYDPPEEVLFAHQNWLYRITRFLDQTNVLEFFETPVSQEPEPCSTSSAIQLVHWGRLKASKYFFRIADVRTDRKLWESFKALATSYRAFQCQRICVDKMKHDLDQATKRTFDLGRSLDDQISRIAFTYTTIENPKVRPEMIINGHLDVTDEVREKIMLNCKL